MVTAFLDVYVAATVKTFLFSCLCNILYIFYLTSRLFHFYQRSDIIP